MHTCCKIQWIDGQGKSTPDDNPAVAMARTVARQEWIHGRQVSFTASEWFPICAEHSKRLSERGMHIWETKPI